MTWLLIITLSVDGQTATFPAGLMLDQGLCSMAGAGIVHFLKEGTPGVEAGWACELVQNGEAV
ncbi:hypothetical protein [Neotabrizicola sp. sgz301269]|uniref:hypothetical protein n=1 Tax=Neotabrizicola sp. sgz301269 TaxID=3276282 RepID=UPI00376FFAA9